MAAWFVMLILLSSVLLAAAAKIEKPSWAAGFLVVSTIVLVFAVVLCVLLMLTKFRPHLQDGRDYSAWLRDERRYANKRTDVFVSKNVTELPLVNSIAQERPDTEDARIKRLELFAETAKVSISVANCMDADEVVASLKVLGFQAEIYRQPFNDATEDTHEGSRAIWLGVNVSPRVSLLAIKASLNVWPFLCYVHLSSDSESPDYTHNEIFIGGSTKTAVEYGLRKWDKDQLESIPMDISVYKFHELIRSRYS